VVRRALLVALVVFGGVPTSASAHALIESTVPSGGQTLDVRPDRVVLDFNEPVEAAFGAVRVFDAAGRAVRAGAPERPGGRSDQVAVTLPRNLRAGGYTVTYRVISADSHPVSGGFVFVYGVAGAPTASVDALLAGTDAGPVTASALSVVRAVQFGAIALGMGALIFFALCWLPGLADVTGGGEAWRTAAAGFSARVRHLLVAAGLVGASSGTLAIALQGANAGGTSLWAALDAEVVADVLGTRFGTVWLAGVVGWVAVTALAAARLPPLPVLRTASVGATGLAPPGREATIALGVLAVPLAVVCLIPALGGHAGVQRPQALLLPANLLHVLAMAAWLGGVAVLVGALRNATRVLEGPERLRLLAAVVSRFSAMAGIAIAVILATGVVQSVIYVESFGNLVDTAFGRSVLVKLVLFAAICSLGYVNRRRVLPRLRAAGSAATEAGALLRRTLRLEVLLGVAVIAVTGALAGYPPATATSAGPFSASAPIGPARVEVTVDPARVGANELHLYLFDRRDGAQYDGADEVTVTARLPDKQLGPIRVEVSKAGPGHYTAPVATLGIAGTWKLEIGARVGEFDLFTAGVDVPVA